MSDVCVLDQETALATIETNLETLFMSANDEERKAIKEIIKAVKKGIKEIEDTGLTPESCKEVSDLMLAAELDTRWRITANINPVLLRTHVGLMMVHQTMQLVSLSQGINEGPKDCEPWC